MTGSKLTTATLMMGLFLGNALAGGLSEESAPWPLSLVPSFSLSSRLPADVAPAATRVLVESPLSPTPARTGFTPPAPPAKPARAFRPRPWLAAAEVAGINLGTWAVLHYTTDAYYAYISWETMRDNFHDGFEWDQSRYFVNFYHHPYHGYLYYTAGRATGLGYWGSSLCAFGGSLMWETVMEKFRPSINDLVTTTCGGIVYGEIGYRFSALVRKRGARGFGRVWREAVGGILDPVGALNRLLNGRDDSVSGAPGRPDDETPLHGEVLLAGPVIRRSASLEGTKAVPLVAFTLNYGDPARKGWGGKPFDLFTVQGRLRWGPDRPHLSLSIGGVLAAKDLPSTGGSSHYLGVYQYYEYYGIDTLRLGGSSIAGGLTSLHALAPNTRLKLAARLGWLVLGGADDFYHKGPERREYNYGTGWLAGAEAGFGSRRFEYVSATWKHFGLYTLQGQKGSESWDILQGRVSIPISRKLGAGVQGEYCERHIDFEDQEPGERRVFEVRAFVTCQF
ncbi:MAG: DUF3943 domain-containing protein [Candidatus Aminicenantes bacterium]|nr:DUF3943 domain-containing protein [Candidatus Aminicenantes bacterium]